MTATENTSEIRYNVFCQDCDQVWTPAVYSPLWWAAKQRADSGKLDALCCTGKQCGCIKPQDMPDAPYRVFGYNDLCEDFDFPLFTFVDAVKKYREFERAGGYVVFIEGISHETRLQIDFGTFAPRPR
jgi:hypothetical protein